MERRYRGCYQGEVRALVIPVVTLLLIASAAAAQGSFDKGRAPGFDAKPLAQAADGAGIVVLRTPGPSEVLLRSGTFLMGSTATDVADAVALCRLEPDGADCAEEMFAHEFPQHEVLLSDFWIDRTEVTQGSYAPCVTAGICRGTSLAGSARFRHPDLPVVLVSHQDAEKFCTWAGKRLPTEAEWERAARGFSRRIYPWGNVYNASLVNHGRLALSFWVGTDWTSYDASDGFLELAPVGSFVSGRTPDGIDDLAGNVEEWVADWYAPDYPSTSEVNPKGPERGDLRVVRGGGFVSARPFLRAAARASDPPSARRAWRGFRCARTP